MVRTFTMVIIWNALTCNIYTGTTINVDSKVFTLSMPEFWGEYSKFSDMCEQSCHCVFHINRLQPLDLTTVQ